MFWHLRSLYREAFFPRASDLWFDATPSDTKATNAYQINYEHRVLV